ncbi:phosphoadenylyl-sulfate reductase [Thioflexithrix psekupsensis]|uniref:Adenosine 5'-phosphosulfate reductase n=1 Tax=Thioflexithrix psekupsensis TaxID=1570016 RepID=A0A251X6V9_9GAMM|nr:phosphoadenylyl-sulfate reductase [Thioflexithrix psekupsensis]OUD13554.1 phosphoadenosine phosphosulfate reductase [Thioflexithrix psekupsensis]
MSHYVQQIEAWADQYADRDPQAILEFALQEFDSIAISFSGAEDVVLIDMATRLKKPISVFSLDTGRLHGETYKFLEKVRLRYDLDLEILFPESSAVQELVQRQGLYGFYREGHYECCAVRKVEPLRKKLSTLSAWITGQRRDQSPTRHHIPVVQIDPAFSTVHRTLIKFNPLAEWRSEQVWQYIREHNVPYNPLHTQGFVSIGCEPCTRAVLPNQHEREGRWWWENTTAKECGLHAGNLGRSIPSTPPAPSINPVKIAVGV